MNYKKTIAAFLCFCLAAPIAATSKPLSNNTTVAADSIVIKEDYVQEIVDEFVCKNYGDHIEIYSVMSNATGEITVPAEINGIPVTVIGEHAFAGCQNITSVNLPDSVTAIGKQAFSMCYKLETVVMPSSIKEIGDETFLNCTSFKNINLPSELSIIGIRAFYGCTKLESIEIPDSVVTMGTQAFDACKSLSSANVPKNISILEEGTFSGTAITEMTIPYNVTSIGMRALPSTLKTLTIINPDCCIDESYYMWNIKSDECVIIAPKDSKAGEFASTYNFEFKYLPGLMCEPLLMGDANNDGEFTVADLVMLQKWFIGAGELTAWQLADFTGDGVIDSFELCLMRKNLVKKMGVVINPSLITNLTAKLQSEAVTGLEADDEFIMGQTDFALSLLKNSLSESGDNTLVSPYSVVQALAMTANGADGDTKTEMENTFGGLSIDKLNKYLYTQRNSQSNDEKCKLSTANSIWTRDDEDRIKVSNSFLQSVVDYFGADVFKAPFDDTTKDAINQWVKENTDEMIPEIIDEISDDAVMYLINAVAFDAKWEKQYTEDQVADRYFNSYRDEFIARKVPTLCSTEDYYIEDENATGILKYYEGGRYAFAALLPNEGITVDEYINGLTAQSLNTTLSSPLMVPVYTELPKFSYDYDIELNDALCAMGMPTAFKEEEADFTKMATTRSGALYIGLVKHKTHIELNEAGTRAAAVTAVMMVDCTVEKPIYKEIKFDRPFVYAIVDTETSLPIFIGTLTNVSE